MKSGKNKNIPSIQKWSYDHFLCAILIYASYADYDYSTEEREHILSHVDQKKLHEVELVFETLGEYQQLDLILTLKKEFITRPKDKSKIMEVLNSHFESDGDFSRLEAGLYRFLEKLL